MRLGDTVIPAHEATQVNISDVVLAAKNLGAKATTVEVLNNGRPGALIGALTSTNRSTNLTYDVPLRDSGKIGQVYRKLSGSLGLRPFQRDNDQQHFVKTCEICILPSLLSQWFVS